MRYLVDRIFTSEEAGCCKPDALFYKAACPTIGCSETNTCMIGDSLDSDNKGAVCVGIRAIMYGPEPLDYKLQVYSTTVPIIYDTPSLLTTFGVMNYPTTPDSPPSASISSSTIQTSTLSQNRSVP